MLLRLISDSSNICTLAIPPLHPRLPYTFIQRWNMTLILVYTLSKTILGHSIIFLLDQLLWLMNTTLPAHRHSPANSTSTGPGVASYEPLPDADLSSLGALVQTFFHPPDLRFSEKEIPRFLSTSQPASSPPLTNYGLFICSLPCQPRPPAPINYCLPVCPQAPPDWAGSTQYPYPRPE